MEFFLARLQSVRAELQKLKIYSADLYAKKILLQYAVVRAFQPEIVVETGVANGVSSAYITPCTPKLMAEELYTP